LAVRAIWLALLAVAVLLVPAVAASAITVVSPRWAHLTPPASPPAGFRDPMAYDAATKQLVLYDEVNGETWIWNGTTWTPVPLPPSATPPTRRQAVMAYDGRTQQLILFGGITRQDQTPLGDTWNWTGTGWVQLSPAHSPPPTYQAAMAFDGATGQLVMFGGVNPSVVSADTWIWNGSDWSQAAPATVPPTRLAESMAYDPATSQLLMFGGVNVDFRGDTWNWTGSNWIKLNPTASPSPRSFAALAYASRFGQLILSSGSNGSNLAINDTWTWTGANWSKLSPAANQSPPRYGAAMTDDPPDGQLLLFGGATNPVTSIGDTWAWTSLAVETATLPTGAVGAPYSATLQAVAGKTPYTWSVSAGALPPGLSLSSTGVIKGIPTAAGTTTFSVHAVESSTTPQVAFRPLTITINPSPQPAVWVGNGANSDINAFSLTATGNAAPQATLSGTLTSLNGIGGLAFDEGGQLWAASANNSAIEQFAPGAHGNVAPSRVVAGPDTALLDPAGIAFDSFGRIYVVNGPSQAITIYPRDAAGNTPPQRTISGANTGLSAPGGITIDHNGHIWVANRGNSTLTEYPANANGDAAPMATIGGPTTQLNTPDGLGQDSSGNLLVGNSFGRSVLRFANAAPFGDVAPKGTISGPQSQLSTPQGVDVDTARRTYVADSGAGLLVFAAGASTPATVLTGPATDIKAAGTVAVAPPFEVTTGTLPRAALARRYSGRLMAILGKAPLRWRRVRGHLPRGLKLSGSGRVTGTARRTGRYRFTVRVADSERRRQTAQATVTLTVARAPAVTGLSRHRGSRRGGQTLTLTGRRFSRARHGTTVAFGRIRAVRVTCHSTRRCTVRTPPGRRGTVRVTVTVAGLSSSTARVARYRYTR
jgi:hypothetical protein